MFLIKGRQRYWFGTTYITENVCSWLNWEQKFIKTISCKYKKQMFLANLRLINKQTNLFVIF